ncbi:MAG: nucleotidyltransferase family protein [Clostridia bacterium]|nr:nucleotidyltransferase family protein [Clostridia bacterium]
MKICAIVCEYNPFHTGHLYQLLQAGNRFDKTICIMSGNFVQRAEPAIVEKYTRAKVALCAGADMVIELPLKYAIANGEKFANGAIKTLSTLSDISAIVMGCETDDTQLLEKIAQVQTEQNDIFKSILSESLALGNSYASSITRATFMTLAEDYDEEKIIEILSKPNNLLCIEYIKAIKKYCPKTEIVLIKRKGADYNSLFPTKNYASATAIRDMFYRGEFTQASAYLTAENGYLIDEFNAHKPDLDLFGKICALALKNAGVEGIKTAYDCREGIEYKLYENAVKYNSLDEILLNTKSKRYTYSRLKRIVLQVLLGITSSIMESEDFIPPRLLAIKETFKPYLTENADKMIIRASDIDKFNSPAQIEHFACERRASNVFALIANYGFDLFNPQKLFTI